MPACTPTGWKGVSYISRSGSSKPFQAKIWQGGEKRSLGTSATAAEAALAYARHLGPAGCAAALAPPDASELVMTEAEARQLAAAEGLSLVLEENTCGYKGLSRSKTGAAAPSRPRSDRTASSTTSASTPAPWSSLAFLARRAVLLLRRRRRLLLNRR